MRVLEGLAYVLTSIDLGALAAAAAGAAEAWIDDGWRRAPALMLGLAMLLALPPLMILGLVLGRAVPDGDTTLRSRARHAPAPARADEVASAPAPGPAWLEVEGSRRVLLESELVRLGRDEENEIQLAHRTVHRFHAVIQRGGTADYVVADLSSREGNGILINGKRATGATRLRHGDRLSLGEAELRFLAHDA